MGTCVRLIVPTNNGNELVPIIGRIVGRFGGTTVTKGNGCWASKQANGCVTRDAITVLDTSVPMWSPTIRQWWVDLAEVVREEWGQESVFLSIHEETAFLVESDSVTTV